jgi:hypothetical protein
MLRKNSLRSDAGVLGAAEKLHFDRVLYQGMTLVVPQMPQKEGWALAPAARSARVLHGTMRFSAGCFKPRMKRAKSTWALAPEVCFPGTSIAMHPILENGRKTNPASLLKLEVESCQLGESQ